MFGGVDPVDHTGREHDLLAEDPRAGVDNDVARADVVGRLVDLPDASVGRLDAEAREVDACPLVTPIGPDVGCRHRTSLLSRRTSAACGGRLEQS